MRFALIDVTSVPESSATPCAPWIQRMPCSLMQFILKGRAT